MTHRMTRKQFGGALLGGAVLLLIQSCGGGGGGDYASPSTDGGTGKTGCGNTISGNHGHILVVAIADLDSTIDKIYDIYGTADHTHTVTLTAADLAKLKGGTTVLTTTSTTLAHSHNISISCV